MEIIIKDIPEEGVHLHLDSHTNPEFRQILSDSLEKTYCEADAGNAEINLLRTGPNVDCQGEVLCEYHPECGRCLKVFDARLEVPFHLTLAPLYESDRQLKLEQKEEVELVMEDLEFAYYEGDRFNLGNIIREQVLLAFPLQPLCDAACKGLCQRCGKDWNEGPCDCQDRQEDSRWAQLKALKSKVLKD